MLTSVQMGETSVRFAPARTPGNRNQRKNSIESTSAQVFLLGQKEGPKLCFL
jgi:hypothetical protein